MKINLIFEGRLEIERVKRVRRESVCAGGRIIEYGLFEFASETDCAYCITVSESDLCEARIISSRSDAENAFLLISQGCCPPYVLDDVLCDLELNSYNIL
ncbi:MAG: hypothetical protein E7640_05500 [Ruminococcaceae bacterium]|nr:hypothetical protein [Oscillospiraceae bacterium]